MIGKPTTHARSRTGRGALWVVAAIPMLIGPTVFDGDGESIGIGVLFLILGIADLRNNESSVPTHRIRATSPQNSEDNSVGRP